MSITLPMARRAGAALSAVALALAVAPTAEAGTAHSAKADTGRHDAKAAAGWLAGQLTKGLMHNDQYGFDDYGLTADTALALTAIGSKTGAQTTIRKALAKNVDAYTTYKKDVFAGSVAKLAVAAKALGAKPTSFGGVNLVNRLQQRILTSGATKGRLQDKGATDYANTIGQVFAVRALTDAKSGKAAAATSYLLQQQCKGGWFRLSFAKATAAKQACDGGPKKISVPDADTTALALIELNSSDDPAVQKALAKAATWLAKQVGATGGVGGGPTTRTANANSTGLAAWALGLAGDCHQASHAARWLVKHQVGTGAGALKSDTGAIAYDTSAMKVGVKKGITTKTADQWRRATTQAAPGLLYLSASRCLG